MIDKVSGDGAQTAGAQMSRFVSLEVFSTVME